MILYYAIFTPVGSNMLELLMIFNLVCSPTLQINRSDDPWNPHDMEMMGNSQKTCFQKYSPRSPCLTKFIKIRPRGYYAICGPALKDLTDTTAE